MLDPAYRSDRALLLIGFAGVLRRPELVGGDVDHVRATRTGQRLMSPNPGPLPP